MSLTDAGANVVELPVIAITEPDDWSAFDTCIGKSIERPYDWVIFASQNAVTATIQRLDSLNCQTFFDLTKVASIGSATSKLLASLGIKVDFEPTSFIAQALASELIHKYNITGKHILLPRADIGREILDCILTDAGAHIDSVVAYKTTLPKGDSDHSDKVREIIALLQKGAIDYITVASSQSVRNLAMLLKNDLSKAGAKAPEIELVELMSKTRIIAIGPVTAQTALVELGQEAFVASEHSTQGMLQAILTVLKFPKKAV